jgi:hypothetical protein
MDTLNLVKIRDVCRNLWVFVSGGQGLSGRTEGGGGAVPDKSSCTPGSKKFLLHDDTANTVDI